MARELTRALVALTLAVVPVAGCSHDDHHEHAARVDTTSGDDHAAHPRARVTTRDTDHDGTDDTLAVRDQGPTVTDQGESASDVEITRQIRAAVVADSSLSFGARNCAIITSGGNVTLRGDVTPSESAAIERHATQAAGVVHVDNQLHVVNESDTH